jgi:hypothetical protein
VKSDWKIFPRCIEAMMTPKLGAQMAIVQPNHVESQQSTCGWTTKSTTSFAVSFQAKIEHLSLLNWQNQSIFRSQPSLDHIEITPCP